MIKGKSFPVCFLRIYLFRKADFISLIERAYLEVNLAMVMSRNIFNHKIIILCININFH